MSSNLKLLIVEDEVLIAEHLEHIILKKFCFTIKQAYNEQTALQLIDEFLPNLVLLDIRLKKNFEGIRIAKILNEHYQIPFIFITSFTNDLVLKDAIDTKPFSFLSKPFKEVDVIAAIQIAFNYVSTNKNAFIVVKEGIKSVRIRSNEILYAKAMINYIYVYTETKKLTLRVSLQSFLEKVNNNSFIQVHRSYLINTNHITSFSSDFVIINNITIPVSRKHKAELFARLKN